MEELNINMPEFWEQVKGEYNRSGTIGICHSSIIFRKCWDGDEAAWNKIREHASTFLKSWKGECKKLGYTLLFDAAAHTPIKEDIAVRHAFIDYMLEKTKKDLQDKK